MGDIYDGVFRTIVNDCRRFLIPFVNEVFHENYTGAEEIQFLVNEHFIDKQDQPDEKKITDSAFKIIGEVKTGKYHLECESSRYSSRMIIRLFEYDAQIALDEAELGRKSIHVVFPKTMVLYLRDRGNPPDQVSVRMETPGGTVSYEIPVMKMSSYGIEDIFEKKLYLLIPFYIFNFEKEFSKYEDSPGNLRELQGRYREVADRLEQLIGKDGMTSFDKRTILELSYDVIRELTRNYQKLWKGMGDVMSGVIIETEARRLLNEGISQGISQGITQGKADSVIELLEDLGSVPQGLKDYIYEQEDPKELHRMLKLAAGVESVEEFEEKAEILIMG